MIRKWISQIRFRFLMRRLNKETRDLKVLLDQQQNNIEEAVKLIAEYIESENETKDESFNNSKV